MNKVISQFRTTIQGIESSFHFEAACPTAVAKEALLECLKWIGQIEDAAKAAQAQAEKENPPQEVQDVQPGI